MKNAAIYDDRNFCSKHIDDDHMNKVMNGKKMLSSKIYGKMHLIIEITKLAECWDEIFTWPKAQVVLMV